MMQLAVQNKYAESALEVVSCVKGEFGLHGKR